MITKNKNNWMERFEDWLFEYFIRFFLFALAFVFLISFGFAYLCNNYPTITLNKNEWKCIRTHEETKYRTMIVGKMIQTYPRTVNVCDLYEKRVIE